MSMHYLNQMQTRLSQDNYPGFIALWEEYCLSDEVDPHEMILILKAVKASALAFRFGEVVETGLILWEKFDGQEVGFEILKLIFDLQTTHTRELAQLALRVLVERYGQDEPHFTDKIRLVGLKESTQFQGALRRFELLCHFKKGHFVFHTGGWGVGQISEISFLREQVALIFDCVEGMRDLSFTNAFNLLEPMSGDHFLARRFADPDRFEEEGKEDPLSMMHKLLGDLGPLTAAQIKEELYGLVITEEDWNRWWQVTRSKLKKDPLIFSPDSLRGSFKLREQKVSHQDELLKAFSGEIKADHLIHAIYSFLRDFPVSLKQEEFKTALITHLREVLSFDVLTEAQVVQLNFFMEDLTRSSDQLALLIAGKLRNPIELLGNIEIVAFQKRFLVSLHRHNREWVNLFKKIFFLVESALLREYIFVQLLQTPEGKGLVRDLLEQILLAPDKAPALVLWYLSKVMNDPSLPFGDTDGICRFFEAVLILLNLLERTGERNLTKKIHAFLIKGRYASVRKIFELASLKSVEEFLILATKCHTLNAQEIKILHALARVSHPSLAAFSDKYHDKEKKQANQGDPIWSTEEGLNQVKQRIERIATVDTIRNAKEIEEARAYGDLRENAEFKAALEKRDHLQMELRSLSAQLDQAQVIVPTQVDPSQFGVGVVLKAVGGDGSTVELTCLGPWDADLDKGVISSQSKIAKELAGKRVGETFHMQEKELTITALRSYFEN